MRTKIDVLNELKKHLSASFNSMLDRDIHTNEYKDGAFGLSCTIHTKINELLEEEKIIKYLVDMGAINNER